MRTYSNIFIHIPGFTKSDLEFISNSTTHEEVTLLAATCGMFMELSSMLCLRVGESVLAFLYVKK